MALERKLGTGAKEVWRWGRNWAPCLTNLLCIIVPRGVGTHLKPGLKRVPDAEWVLEIPMSKCCAGSFALGKKFGAGAKVWHWSAVWRWSEGTYKSLISDL